MQIVSFLGLIIVFNILKRLLSYIYSLLFSSKYRVNQYLKNQNGKSKYELLIKVVTLILVILIVVFAVILNEIYIPFIFVITFILATIYPLEYRNFKNYQYITETSKINSVDVGLTEIQGRVKVIKTLNSPLGNIPCIGYLYKVDKIHSNGVYTNISYDKKCNPFYMEDKTGKILVSPEKLDFVWFFVDKVIEYNGERRTQYLLSGSDKMLLLGKVTTNDKLEPEMRYDSVHDVFAIAPTQKTKDYNVNKPLFSSFIRYISVFGFIVSLLLVFPVELKDNQLIVNKPKSGFDYFFDKDVSEDNRNIDLYDSGHMLDEVKIVVVKHIKIINLDTFSVKTLELAQNNVSAMINWSIVIIILFFYPIIYFNKKNKINNVTSTIVFVAIFLVVFRVIFYVVLSSFNIPNIKLFLIWILLLISLTLFLKSNWKTISSSVKRIYEHFQ